MAAINVRRTILARLLNVLPENEREWGQAIIGELECVEGFWPLLAWTAGGCSVMTRMLLRSAWVNPYSRAAGTGFVLLLIPVYFVSASLLNSIGVSFLFAPIERWMASPAQAKAFNVVFGILLLGTLLGSFLANAWALTSVGREQAAGRVVRFVKFEARFWNLAAMTLSLALTALLLGYGFVENFVAR